MAILMTGGSGLLGSHIKQLDPKLITPTHSEMDISKLNQVIKTIKKYKPDVVLHLAAATSPPQHEQDPKPGLSINIIGTANLALACHQFKAKMVYASTDYLYSGKGPHSEDEPIITPYKFGWSKIGGECAVRMLNHFLILRLSFGPVPFSWEKVYATQWNSKLYVDEMAPLILKAVKSKATGVMNIGGPRNTLEQYAKRTRPDLKTIPKPDWVPTDTSLDLSKMTKVLKIKNLKQLLKR